MPKQSQKSAKELEREAITEAARYRQWVFVAIKLSLGTWLLISVSALLSLYYRAWPLEAVASYLPQIIMLGWLFVFVYAIAATWYGIVRGWRWFAKKLGYLGVGLTALLLATGYFNYFYSVNLVDVKGVSKELAHQTGSIRVATFNKLYTSVNFAADIAMIADDKVDVLVMQEVDEAEVSIAKGALNLSFSYITECDCSAGVTEVAVLSRYPITNALTIYEHPNSVVVRTVIESTEHGKVIVYGAHMHVPYAQWSYELRDDAMAALKESAVSEEDPVFIAGDFNTTIFSPDMSNLLADQRVFKNSAARGWPHCSWYGFGSALCARVDYVLVPHDAEVHAVQIGDETYSDHRSVITEVSL